MRPGTVPAAKDLRVVQTLYRINKESKSKIEEERYKPSLGAISSCTSKFKLLLLNYEMYTKWTVDMGGSVML